MGAKHEADLIRLEESIDDIRAALLAVDEICGVLIRQERKRQVAKDTRDILPHADDDDDTPQRRTRTRSKRNKKARARKK